MKTYSKESVKGSTNLDIFGVIAASKGGMYFVTDRTIYFISDSHQDSTIVAIIAALVIVISSAILVFAGAFFVAVFIIAKKKLAEQKKPVAYGKKINSTGAYGVIDE